MKKRTRRLSRVVLLCVLGVGIWQRFGTRYGPTQILVDRRGVVRHWHIGEGGYEETEARIRALLAEPA